MVALSAAAAATGEHVTAHPMQLDRNLVVSLRTGWTSVGGPAVLGGDFVMTGNFKLRPTTRQLLKGELPAPPEGKVVVRIVDLPNTTPTANWQHVNRLELPSVPTDRRTVTWHVSFESEAVQISATWGSTHLTVIEKRLIDSALAKVQHR